MKSLFLILFCIILNCGKSQTNFISIPFEGQYIDYLKTRIVLGTGIRYQRLITSKIALGIESKLSFGINNTNTIRLKNLWANELSVSYFSKPAFKGLNLSAGVGYNFFRENQILSGSLEQNLKDRFHFGFMISYNIPIGQFRICPSIGTGAMINLVNKSPSALYYESKISIGYVW
jgi:hypothetical protein